MKSREVVNIAIQPQVDHMKCPIIHPLLSDYIDGGLATGESVEIRSHLEACSACQGLYADLNSLRQAARELPLRSPNSELWTRIRAEVVRESEGFGFSPAPAEPKNWLQRFLDKRITFNLPQLAGAGALAVAATFLGINYIGSSPIAPPPPTAISAAFQLEETRLKARVDEQIGQINMRKASWDPEVREGFESQIARIDQSLEACRRGILNNPQDHDHQQMYLSLYQEKLRLLEDVNRLKW